VLNEGEKKKEEILNFLINLSQDLRETDGDDSQDASFLDEIIDAIKDLY
jgi:hypothetical protein